MSTVEQRPGQHVKPPAPGGRSGYLRLRSRVWYKLALIGLAFMLPVAVSSYFLAIENGRRIDFSQNELRGLEYLRPLGALVVDLGRHRTLNRQVLAGEQPAARLRDAEARIDGDFGDLLAVQRRSGRSLRTTADQLDSATVPAGLVQRWQALWAGEADLTSSDAGHDALLADVRTLIGYVGITSNLTLDPELNTYYGADALVVQAPELTHRIRQLGDSVAELVDGRYTLADRARVASTVALLDLHTDALHDDLFTVFRHGGDRQRAEPFRTALEPLLESAYTAVTDLREHTMRDFVRASTVTLDRASYLHAVEVATDAMTTLSAGLQRQESRLLKLRLGGDAQDRLYGIATMLVALATAGLLTIWLSRRITRGVGVVSRVATDLAGGDLTQRVPVRGGDEIGTLAAAFNSMANRLQETVEKQQSERDFVNAVVDVAGSLVLVLDPDGRIVRFNRTCEVTTGYLATEVKGRLFADLFAATDGTCVMASSTGMPAQAIYIVESDGTAAEYTGDPRQLELTSHRQVTIDIGRALTQIPTFTWTGT